MTVKAVYEAGVLRPLKPLDLKEGQEVDVLVPPARVRSLSNPKAVSDIMDEIAALSVPPPDGMETSSSDHDNVLYGEHGAR